MTINEIEQMASKNRLMPENLSGAEQSAFQALRYLYMHYRQGGIGKDEARTEKNKISKTFDALILGERIVDKYRGIQRAMYRISQDVFKNGCDVCRKVDRILLGLENISQ